MSTLPFALRGRHRSSRVVIRRRLALRARIVVSLEDGVDPAAIINELHRALASVAVPRVDVERVQVGFAVDPAWRGEGPVGERFEERLLAVEGGR